MWRREIYVHNAYIHTYMHMLPDLDLQHLLNAEQRPVEIAIPNRSIRLQSRLF